MNPSFERYIDIVPRVEECLIHIDLANALKEMVDKMNLKLPRDLSGSVALNATNL
jgi:hypothetical protein